MRCLYASTLKLLLLYFVKKFPNGSELHVLRGISFRLVELRQPVRGQDGAYLYGGH